MGTEDENARFNTELIADELLGVIPRAATDDIWAGVEVRGESCGSGAPGVTVGMMACSGIIRC